MAQNYLFIAISFYRNIVHKNIVCDMGLNLKFKRFIILVMTVLTHCRTIDQGCQIIGICHHADQRWMIVAYKLLANVCLLFITL